jgi:hypothetical protein
MLTQPQINSVVRPNAEDAARERVLACGLLLGSDRIRYGKLLEDLEHDYTQGRDSYLSTLQQAYSLIVHWKQDPRNLVRLTDGINDGVAFAMQGVEELATTGRGTGRGGT